MTEGCTCNVALTPNRRQHLLEEVARFVLQQPPFLHDVVKQLPRLVAQSKRSALASPQQRIILPPHRLTYMRGCGAPSLNLTRCACDL